MTGKPRTADKDFVFLDHSGKRWPKVIIISLLSFIFFSIVGSAIGVSLFHNPDLPPVELEKTHKVIPINKPLPHLKKLDSFVIRDQQEATSQITRNNTYGFYTTDDELSKKSLQENIRSLGVVIPNWFTLKSEKIINMASEKDIETLTQKYNVKIMPRLFLKNDSDTNLLHRILHSSSSRTTIIHALYKQIKKKHYDGVNIDFSGIQPEDRKELTAFMTELYQLFHANHLKVTLTGSPNDKAYDYAALSKVIDRFIMMLFDEHNDGSAPGPIASITWSQEILKNLPIPQEKTVVCLGSYGYEWKVNSNEPAKYVSFGDIMEAAGASKLKSQWDPVSRNPYLRYIKDNTSYISWFLDAATAYNQLKLAVIYGIQGVAIKELGYEDPGIWKFINKSATMERFAANLQSMENPIPIVSLGSGEFIKITSFSHEGIRNIRLDKEGFINLEDYQKYPLPFYVKKYGSTDGKKIAITFDDGPNPAYTPKILDILSEKHVPATFFILGSQAALYPDLLKRMQKEGHVIGSHTFSHSNISTDSDLKLQMEMNATQRLIQQITGHSATLFRPPYTTDADYSLKDLLPIIKTQEMGYTMVGSLIDTRDWETRSSDVIVKRVVQSLTDGNIILLHDSGGDRTATIAALPKIIDTLKKRGYQFVPAIQLAGKNISDAMPAVPENSNSYMVVYKITDFLVIIFTKFCILFFTVGIGFGILRMLFLLFFSYRHKRKQHKQKKTDHFKPSVSVVIPAYNEGKVIEKTIHSILQSDYPDFEILVVDDGSTDHTASVIQKTFGHDFRVRLVSKTNGGKASAINQGFFKSNGEIIIILDADTSVARNTISLLINHFTDERVAAVSGNVRIGNMRNLLTLWQHIEYVTGFNLEKRAFHELNCITVVPGAIGAWRKSLVSDAGYFKDDTLAEDTDITLKLLRQGYRITFEPLAYAYTEAPESLKNFIKQRFRWSYGILQCLWKHRLALFNPKQKTLGFIGMPNMCSQYFFQTVAPLADLVFIAGLFGDAPKVMTYYVTFLLLDLFVAFYAFKLEKVSTKPLLSLLIQRLIYRQLLTYTVWKSFISAVKGVLVGWNKLKRSGNVQVPSKKLEEGA